MAIFHGTSIPAGASGGELPTFAGSGSSIRFEREDTHFLERTSHSTSANGAYTTSCWVKRGKLGLDSNSVAKMRYVYRFGLEDHMGFKGDDTLSVEKRSGKHMFTNRYCRDISNWMHVVVSSDGLGNANSFRLYVNGVEHNYSDGGSYDRTADSYSHSNVNFRIGAHENGGSVYDGLVSQFYFIDGQALGPEAFGAADETWGHWKPIEYTGSYNSNSFYLPFSNASTKYTIQSGGGINHVAGISKWGNSSLSFNNTSTYLKVPYSEIGNTMRMAGDFTMELWVKSKETNNSGVFFGNHSHATGHGFAFGFNGTNIVKFWDYPNGFNTGDVNFGYDTSNWFHFAAVRSGSTLKLYKDGVEKTSHTYTHTLPNAQNWPLYIGNDANFH